MVTVDSGRAVPKPVSGWVEVREQRNKMRSFKCLHMTCCP